MLGKKRTNPVAGVVCVLAEASVCVFVSKSWDPTLLDFKNKDSSGFHFCKQPYALVLS